MNNKKTNIEKETVFNIVAKVSGYEINELHGSMDIESDLGFDSIKKIELANALLAVVAPDKKDRLLQELSELITAGGTTLDGLVDYFQFDINPNKSSLNTTLVTGASAMESKSMKTTYVTSDAVSTSHPVYESIERVTGFSIDEISLDMMLDADLGIDSIKSIELLNAIKLNLPDHRQSAFEAKMLDGLNASSASVMQLMRIVDEYLLPDDNHNSPTDTKNNMGDNHTGSPDWLLEIIATVTGYHVSDLTLDMSLETELGFDSIKTLELMNAISLKLPEKERHYVTQLAASGELQKAKTIDSLLHLLMPVVAGLGGASSVKNTDPEQASVSTNLPLIDAQLPFLVAHMAVSTCSLNSRVRLRAKLDRDMLNKTWLILLERHSMLRAKFCCGENTQSLDQYTMMISDRVQAPNFAVEDLQFYSHQEQETYLLNRVHHNINQSWNISRWPLHRFEAYVTGKNSFEVFFTNHHLISDGLSNQQIMREFVDIYNALLQGKEVLIGSDSAKKSYVDITRSMNQWQDPDADKKLAAYNQLQYPGKYVWCKEKSKQHSTNSTTHTYSFSIEKTLTRSFIELTKSLRVSMNTLLIASYIQSLSQLETQDEARQLVINIPTSGRNYPGADAADQVGCFAQNLAMSFNYPDKAVDKDYLQMIQRKMDSAIGNNIDMIHTKQIASALKAGMRLEKGILPESMTAMVRNGVKTNLYMPYIGHTGLEQDYGSVWVERYQAATVTNTGAIDTLIEIFADQLHITINYDSHSYDSAFVASIADQMNQNMAGLITCLKHELVNEIVDLNDLESTQETDVVIALLNDITRSTITIEDRHEDLEAKLGIDSLERIRLVTHLRSRFPEIDHKNLLKCRTIHEISSVISKTPSQSVETVPESTNEELPYMKILAQAKHTPDALAIVADDGQLTYRQLDIQSNKIASYLSQTGTGPNAIIGVMLGRQSNFLVAVLGVLSAGAAYLPLDPDYPDARLMYMVEHSQLSYIISDEENIEKVNRITATLSTPVQILCLNQIPNRHNQQENVVYSDVWEGLSYRQIQGNNHTDDLMVVLYTSGSTGNPKGVSLSHRGYINRFQWHQELFQLRAGERVAQKTSTCFDVSVWELFWPLMHGGVVVHISSQTLCDPWELSKLIKRHRIAVMHFVPSMFGEFLTAHEINAEQYSDLRWLIFSGEALPVTLVNKWISQYGNQVKLANLYGPTEASIDVTAHIIDTNKPVQSNRIPIGKAMPGVDLYVLDENGQRVKDGEQGELWLGGIQLADGYYRDAQRTKAAFQINTRVSPGNEVSLYKTGDLVNTLPDGALDYRGRCDSQIKIRGFRVELGEVDATLSKINDVTEAVALVENLTEGQKRLHAVLVGKEREHAQIRQQLMASLPHYMVPHKIHWVNQLCKNINGKVDRKAIAKQIGIDHEKTVTDSSPNQNQTQLSPLESLKNITQSGLGPAQSWLVNYFSAPYQWAGFTRFTYLLPLDLSVFTSAINRLIERHDALRSVFVHDKGVWSQLTGEPTSSLEPVMLDGTHMTPEQRESQIEKIIDHEISQFQLNKWPLIRVYIIKESFNRFDISFIGHHMINDMLSNQLLFNELWAIYKHLLQSPEKEINLPPAASFNKYATELHNELDSKSVVYTQYWKEQFPEEKYTMILPYDYSEGQNNEFDAVTQRFTYNADRFSKFSAARASYRVDQYSLLSAALYRLVSKWMSSECVALSHRMHGRKGADNSLYLNCAGNFAINYPIGIELNANESWTTLSNRINQKIAEVPLSGCSYDLLGAANQLPAYLYPDNKIAPVRINYLGQRDIRNSPIIHSNEHSKDRRYLVATQKRISEVEVFLSIVDNQLIIDIEYSRKQFSPKTIISFGQQYMDLLDDISGIVAQELVPLTQDNKVRTLSTKNDSLIPDGPLTGQVAIVTGGSRGIGKTIAKTLLSQGACVAIVSRTQNDLDNAVEELWSFGARVIGIATDVTVLSDVEKMVAIVKQKYGKINILINNAGITGIAALHESDPVQWQHILNTNVIGTYNCTRSVLSEMSANNRGKIINMGSDSSLIGYPLFSAYAASKHAVLGMTKSLAEELKPNNIQVNCICPSFVDTRMTPKAFRQNSIPTEQIANIALFLSTSQSDSMTGEYLKVFGKQDMYWYGSEKMALLKGISA